MIGDYYECNPVQAPMVIAEADSWIFAGTGWKNGDQLPDAVGNEYDRVTPEAPAPRPTSRSSRTLQWCAAAITATRT